MADNRPLNYKHILEKIIDLIKKECSEEGHVNSEYILNKIIGLSVEMGLEDIKEKVLDVKDQKFA